MELLWKIGYTVGLCAPKPEFITVLADKDVEKGENVLLYCEANVKELTAVWEKDGQRLSCVQGKHKLDQKVRLFVLEINKAQEGDEGKYTLTLKNKWGSKSCSATVTFAIKEWRNMPKNQSKMVTALKHYKTCNDDISELRFLLHGQIGAGKSSIINTIKSIFENRQFVICLAATTSGTSHTLDYQKYTAGSENTGRLPFAFYDVMGLENNSGGVHTDDIIKALKGHIQNGYTFNPDQPISEDSEYYISKPRLSDKIHCLVSVVATDRIVLMEDVISKMKLIRKEASELGIPQVVFMTRVDEACVLTKNDLSRIYRSRKIKDKMHECSNKLGVPLNCIFPVKNYHDETGLNDNINCLMLEALTQIVLWADDYVKRCSEKQRHVE
ncbi:hypothetical protein SRHO_G00032120 [Serrasalmus rhombeus]